VPRPGFDGKVFYVWFDAPIGYIAAGIEWAEATGRDWRTWWQGGDDVRYVQFLGKDNVPFHTITFPATLLGSGLPFKLPDFIKGFNWLTFAGGKFSSSRRRGIFTDAALEELPADYWRWWLAANAPETADTDFAVERFALGVNKDLAHVFGNLVNRCLAFVAARFDGVVPAGGAEGASETALAERLGRHLHQLREAHLSLHTRRAAAETRVIWSTANAYLAAEAPWSVIKVDRTRAAVVTRTAVNLVRLAAILAWPFIPSSAERVLQSLGEFEPVPPFPDRGGDVLSAVPAGRPIVVPSLLFPELDAEMIARLVARYEQH
jgi:methionyl-tRNA synthetase